MAGAVAKKLLDTIGVEVLAHTIEIGGIKAIPKNLNQIKKAESNPLRCADIKAAEEMVRAITRARIEGDSLGGIIEGLALNVPAGLGEPVFDTLDGELAKALFAIPAVKPEIDIVLIVEDFDERALGWGDVFSRRHFVVQLDGLCVSPARISKLAGEVHISFNLQCPNDRFRGIGPVKRNGIRTLRFRNEYVLKHTEKVMEALLNHIVNSQSELVILDVTGVTSMNTEVANYVMQTVRSASLLGAPPRRSRQPSNTRRCPGNSAP
jgi:hypothetical protein